MKWEWRKQEKQWYAPGKAPASILLPAQKFIMLSGKGNPNGADFSERVGILYSLSYGVKSACKKLSADGVTDYTVYPLEGVWGKEGNSPEGTPLEKDKLAYTIMIRQPDFVTQELFEAVLQTVRKKKPHPLLEEAVFGVMEDGLCIEILHSGSYDDEPASFEQMDAFARENGFARVGGTHREIYLSDATRVPPEKRRTILRYRVQKKV